MNQPQSVLAADATPANKVINFPTKYGDVELREDRLLSFPKGLKGLEHWTVFGLAELEGTPFMLMPSINQPEYTLLIADPEVIGFEYAAADKAKALAETGFNAKTTQWVVLVHESRNPKMSAAEEATDDSMFVVANMRAPLLIDTETRMGMQYIFNSEDYPLQYKL